MNTLSLALNPIHKRVSTSDKLASNFETISLITSSLLFANVGFRASRMGAN